LLILAILPEGSVRDEGSFIVMVIILAALIGVAFYLRRRNKEKESEPTSGP
jgi:LPXTG-motif cell wall-anchored protein